jgi:hypothetical protein
MQFDRHSARVQPIPPSDPRRRMDFGAHPPKLSPSPDVRPRPTTENLAKIRILFRDIETLALWGLPYDNLRPGQEPRHIDRRWRGDWIWLGSPGWFGGMSPEEQAAVKAFLATHREQVPTNAYEWSKLARVEVGS